MPTGAVTADPDTPVMQVADAVAVLDFADEESVVQTRFATANLALLRAHLEAEDALPAGVLPLDAAVKDAERAVTELLDAAVVGAEQFTFLGTGWTCGLALEAALKMRKRRAPGRRRTRRWSTGTARSASPGRARDVGVRAASGGAGR